MNKQRKVVITTTYNEMGVIIDTKAEELGSSAQPEPCEDTISRQAAIDRINKQREHLQPDIYPQDEIGDAAYRICAEFIERLPSAQPERTCVNCGRTANNGGWYADGGTRCPIEEHYALPKDGYCHLWEKRNVTDDDYPERREE